MSVRSVLRGCHETLCTSANRFRSLGDIGSGAAAARCEIQADAVLKLLADLDSEQQEETSDGPA